MITDLRAVLYFAITLLICGALTFFGGLTYLIWLVVTEPGLL